MDSEPRRWYLIHNDRRVTGWYHSIEAAKRCTPAGCGDAVTICTEGHPVVKAWLSKRPKS